MRASCFMIILITTLQSVPLAAQTAVLSDSRTDTLSIPQSDVIDAATVSVTNPNTVSVTNPNTVSVTNPNSVSVTNPNSNSQAVVNSGGGSLAIDNNKGPTSSVIRTGPTQFDTEDIKVSTGGKCKVRTPKGEITFKYKKSPCERLYGQMRVSTNTSNSSSDVDQDLGNYSQFTNTGTTTSGPTNNYGFGASLQPDMAGGGTEAREVP